MTAHAVRVAVVGRVDALAAGDGTGQRALDVVAAVPEIGELFRAPSHEHEVAVVGCTSAQLRDGRFQAQLAQLARAVPMVLVVPCITRHAAIVAARSRALGLVARHDPDEQLARSVRAARRREVAYPPDALAVLLRLLRHVPISRT